MFFSRFICLFVIALFFSFKSFGQVNLQSGGATFSIPMFDWKDDKSRLYSVVALNYNSGNGLKVNEIASNTGQGWSMIGGGVVSRLQVGEPDDQVIYGLTSELDTKKYPNGYLYNAVPPQNGCPIALTQYPIYKSKNQVYSQHNEIAEDKQVDYFSFQFNGKTGLFVLEANGNKGISLGDNKLKITFQRDISVITK